MLSSTSPYEATRWDEGERGWLAAQRNPKRFRERATSSRIDWTVRVVRPLVEAMEESSGPHRGQVITVSPQPQRCTAGSASQRERNSPTEKKPGTWPSTRSTTVVPL